MKNNISYIKSHVRVIMLLMVMGQFMLVACGDDDTASTDTAVLSFGPSGVRHGEDIIIIGTNLDKVSSILFRPSVEVSDFKEHSPGSILVTVPQEAEPGTLILRTSTQEIETKTILNLEVPVTISSVTPSAKPGTEITVTGDKLNWVESIIFSSDITVLKESFVTQSSSELKVTVPMAAQTGFITFSAGGTEPLVFAHDSQLEVLVPVISALNPTAVRHESTLTIEGANLDLVTEVIFSEDVSITSGSFTAQSETAIELTVPATAVQGKVTLKQAAPVDVESSGELVIVLPAGTSIAPETQKPGIDEVTITGSDLDLVASLQLPGHGTMLAADFTSHTAGSIVFDLPEAASLGVINYTTIHGFSGPLGLAISLPSSGLGALLIPLYVDAIDEAMSEGGGWSSTTDFANTENPREGENSIKVTYEGGFGGGAQLGTWGKSPVSIAGSQVFAFSLFGGDGTDGKQLNLNVKSDVDNTMLVTIKEGEWVDFEIPIADFGSPAEITEIWFQDQGWSGTVYVDRMGFDL
ncbi:hypothetical protein FNH22_26225 [Fulvivirga sp. M361]|uniref:hypothetical protein n=1 Tax=Fulvivirga sp. M361 TaxID=2594266 RepID=UPI001179C0E7|nr:hypothetical protein [Fulvivirga sp. M361]TRX50025.1 hypothetical protein FNH22_26225 [Fulvivirga sp. M361]